MTPGEHEASSALPPSGAAALGAGHAGAMLREAREAAGASLDMIAHQLKLAPRQVKALEDGDYTLLPGRTFVRGFARNYARVVGLDPQVVIDALPGATPEGGLEAPPLHATAVKIGELPSTASGAPAWLRWTLPLVLVVAIGALVAYQYFRGNPGRPAAPDERSPASATAPGGPATPTPLENPVMSAPLATMPDRAPAEPQGAKASEPAAAPPALPSGAPATAAPGSPVAAAGAASLAVAARAASWVEVKDGTGRTLLSQTVPAGQSPSVSGVPPFDVVIGNASAVTLTLRGAPVDLDPSTRGNVARLTLR